MYRLLALILLVLIVLLQYKLWQGEGSWTSEQALQRQVEEQQVENAKLKLRNGALAAEVEDLKHGEAAVEERARTELGMVKPGETFYRVVEPSSPGADTPAEDVPEDAGSTNASSAASAVVPGKHHAHASGKRDTGAASKQASPR
ncbi:MAG: cell division protein FtsB [Proteobacteria bacterium]|nr:cell division protein FtsB [Pseudomonadota bacterium]